MSSTATPGAAKILEWIVSHLSSHLGIPEEGIDPREGLAGHGVTSKEALGMLGDLERWLGRDLSATLPWSFPSIDALADHLGNASLAAAPSEGIRSSPGDPVAVIGIGCRLPGASGPREFWQLLQDGRDEVAAAPTGRRAVFDRLAPSPHLESGFETYPGGYLEGVDLFDAEFFGLSRREAESMDPQQRLLLEVAWEAFEDAGQVHTSLAGSRTGVFIGISTHDYGDLMARDPQRHDAYLGTGTSASIAPNRISYFFDLHGPSLAIDTACSSSLVAVDAACSSLRASECSLALAGGVNLILSPALTISFARGGFLSPTGKCRTFDRAADGYVRGEGCGVVVLKPLSLARRDRDPVYAVILGSGVEQDGRSNGLTAPSRPAQERLLRRVLTRAGMAPSEVSYIEAHGTGTVLGDGIELEALGAVLSAGREPHSRCLVGSVKTNIGHLEAAAGIAGLIKAALIIRHRQIPPSLHFELPNPHIDLEELGLRVPTELSAAAAEHFVVGVSSLGFGGTGAHVLLRSAPNPTPEPLARHSRGAHLLTISARSEESLRQLARDLSDLLRHGDSDLADVCSTACLRRNHHEFRLAVVGAEKADVARGLDEYLTGRSRPKVSAGRLGSQGAPTVLFSYAGGVVRDGSVRELYGTEPAFRAALVECCDLFGSAGESSLLEILIAEEGASPAEAQLDPSMTRLAVDWATTQLWRSWGVSPERAVGRGRGELSAAVVAGTLSLPEAVESLREGTSVPALAGDPEGRPATGAARENEAETIVLEIGADSPLDRPIEDHPDAGPPPLDSDSARRQTGKERLLVRLAELYCSGYPIDWGGLYPETRPPATLPLYPWRRESFWFDPALSPGADPPSARRLGQPGGPPRRRRTALGAPTEQTNSPRTFTWTLPLGVGDHPYLLHHRIHDTAVVPSSVYLELALQAAAAALGEGHYKVTSLRFEQLLSLPEAVPRQLRIRLRPVDDIASVIEIDSLRRDSDESSWTRHAAGRIERAGSPGEVARDHGPPCASA